jgi:acetylglutamate/LysW-gamma-L-alpha-aminoadipate kinase
MLVVKIGGAAGNAMDAVCSDIAALVKEGEAVVLAHGGSDETNAVSEKLGHPPKFVTSPSGFTSRYTDRETLEIFAMVVRGKINTKLVERLQARGVNAFGLSGVDGRLLEAKRKEAIRAVESGRVRMLHDDHTGTIQSVNVPLLRMLLGAGLTPVVAPLAISPEGTALNVDADRAAAMIAGALKAESLVILTNVPGLMRRFPDESTLMPKIERSKLEDALEFAEGRMKKKVLGASEALGEGVRRVIFADSRVEAPVRSALKGKGTVIS